jgi:hypothetical protein
MIIAKLHGLNGMCTVEATRNNFISRVVTMLQNDGVEEPGKIQLSFSSDFVTDGNGEPSSFCIIQVTPSHSTKDLLLLIAILKKEVALGDRIRISNFLPLPKG